MSGARQLVPLLPATKSSSPKVTLPSKKNAIVSACEACRKRKSKCDGGRPCSICRRRDTKCSYNTLSPSETHNQALKRKFAELEERGATLEELFVLLRDRPARDVPQILENIREGLDPKVIVDQFGHGNAVAQPSVRNRATAHEEILELLTNLPYEDAQQVLRRIRDRTPIATIINHVKVGDVLLQMAVLPETRYRYEFPYRSEMPEDRLMTNPYLDSLIYEASSLYSEDRRFKHSRRHEANRVAYLNSEAYKHLYLKPFHAAEVIDPRLVDVDISSWSNVCEDNVLMRHLLAEWLRCEYQFTAAFQKDLFLEDMAARRHDFCSSLLVNVILGYSCVCSPRFANRAEYWNPYTLTYRFIAEAKRLWELEAHKPRITTIQAGMLFNVFYNLCGLDEVGQAYRIQAIALAHNMRLFDSTVDIQNERIHQGKVFTAWALFNWETLVGFSFMFAPLLSLPPDWPLPDPSTEDEWYGEIWVKYPMSNRRLPSYFGQVIKARSQFRIIMNEACQIAYSKGSEMNFDKANKLLSQLKLWYDNLPGPLQPKTIVLPGQLQLHMYYHHLILTIFEPLLEDNLNQEESLQSIIADAKKHLQTLVRLYYLRHGYEAMDLFIVIPLMLLASDCIEALGAVNQQTPASNIESLRSTLILVAKGLYNQRQNHYLAEALFRVIRGRMHPNEIALFRGLMNIDEGEADKESDMAQAVRSHWPVSVVKKKGDLDSHILTNLVENYAHLNMDEDSKAAAA